MTNRPTYTINTEQHTRDTEDWDTDQQQARQINQGQMTDLHMQSIQNNILEIQRNVIQNNNRQDG